MIKRIEITIKIEEQTESIINPKEATKIEEITTIKNPEKTINKIKNLELKKTSMKEKRVIASNKTRELVEREITKNTTSLATLPSMEREADMNNSSMSGRKSPLPLSKRSLKNLNNTNKSLLLHQLSKQSLQFLKNNVK